MLKKYKIYLNESKRNINITVLEPKSYDNLKCLYLLDGQNAFHDKDTLFGRSLRLINILKYLEKYNINILAIGIPSDEFRNDEYSPFKIINTLDKSWLNNDIEYNHKFTESVINDIIPFIDNKYKLINDSSNRIIYGSSLAAIEALYLGLKYDKFKYIGAFSTASFIYDNSFNDFIRAALYKDKDIFIYVGANERSDNEYTPLLYLNKAKELKELLDSLAIKNKLVINKIGAHNEKSWSYYIPDFLKYIYK